MNLTYAYPRSRFEPTILVDLNAKAERERLLAPLDALDVTPQQQTSLIVAAATSRSENTASICAEVWAALTLQRISDTPLGVAGGSMRLT